MGDESFLVIWVLLEENEAVIEDAGCLHLDNGYYHINLAKNLALQ